jgi:exodeoxyribonuclease-3
LKLVSWNVNGLRACMNKGFTDTFRLLYPDKRDAYTWWSYLFDAGSRNVGWRIDYFLVSSRWQDRIRAASIFTDVHGSDHCPVGLELAEP